jgi:hypothetical protein
MKTLTFVIITSILCGSIVPTWASVELDAYLPTSGEPVTLQFKFSKLVTITYPVGGKLKSLLDGQNKTVSFTEDSATNPSVKRLMDDINSQLATGTQSITSITNLQVNYQTRVIGRTYATDIEYSITLIPTVANYVLNKGQDESPTVLDASWTAFDEKGPVIINSEYVDLEINYLIDFIKSQLPDVYNVIKGTDAETALQQNLIDSSQLLPTNSLDRWDSLYDPTYSLTPTLPLNQAGIVVPVTTFTTGLNTLQREHSTRIGGAEFSSDTDYHLDITEKPNVGTINVGGHANVYNLLGKWIFSSLTLSSCCPSPPLVWQYLNGYGSVSVLAWQL